MKGRADACGGKGAVGDAGKGVDAHGKQILQEQADHMEGEVEHQAHDGDEGRDGGVFAGEDTVQALAALALAALPGLLDRDAADAGDKVKAHLRDGGSPVEAALFFHLENNVLNHLRLILIQLELLLDQPVALNELAGGKARGQAGSLGVVFDQVGDAMQAAVDRAAVLGLVAEVLAKRALLIFGNVQGVADKLVHAGVFRRGDGDHRHAELGLHAVDIHAAAVGGDLVHHVERNDHGDAHFQKLHGQIEVALNVGGVDNVDDGLGLFLENEVARDDLFAGIGGHGVDAGQVRDQGIGVLADLAVLAVDGDAGEIANVLVRAGELVEQRGLAAVLVAHKGKGQGCAVRQGRAGALGVELAALAEAGVVRGRAPGGGTLLRGSCGRGGDLYLFSVCQAKRKLIAVEHQLHRVAHWRVFHHGHLGAGDDAHIQKMLAQRALTADLGDDGGFADL